MARTASALISATAAIAEGTEIAAKRKTGARTCAIIVCAGSSTRMGGKCSKQFLEVNEEPVLLRTFRAFCNASVIHEIVAVARTEDIPAVQALWDRSHCAIPFSIVKGGKTRALSVQNGFAAISPSTKFVAIHDGARCLITPQEIEKVCRAAYRHKAASAAHQVNDSVKLADQRGFINNSVDRSTVWLVQTPQVFHADLYRAALTTAKDTVNISDDNALMEQIRFPVKLVECSTGNIKITVPDDIKRAESILRERGECK